VGEEVDFFERDADPKLVAKLTNLRYQDGNASEDQRIAEPELLGRLIESEAGYDFDFKIIRFEEDQRKVAAALRSIRTHARGVLALEERSSVELIAPTVQALMPQPTIKGERVSSEVLFALEAIARLPLGEKNPFSGRPRRHETRQKIVNAVAQYCARVGIPFIPARYREETNTRLRGFHMTEAAHLTLAVLCACDLATGSQGNARKLELSLARHMGEARRILNQNAV
jgi:hypothetical protein